MKILHHHHHRLCILSKMQASTIAKPSLRPQLNSFVKAQPQREAAMKSRYYPFTAEDLYNCLHQKSGNVEVINLEQSRPKKMTENGTDKEMRPSCKLDILYCLFAYRLVGWLVFCWCLSAFITFMYPSFQNWNTLHKFYFADMKKKTDHLQNAPHLLSLVVSKFSQDRKSVV